MVNGSEGQEGLEGDGIVAAAALEEHMEYGSSGWGR